MSGLIRFVENIDRVAKTTTDVLEANRIFEVAVREISSVEHSVSTALSSLRVVIRESESYIGNVTARSFNEAIKLGKSLSIYEEALGEIISGDVRSAFQRLDNEALKTFPEASLISRDATVTAERNELVSNGIINDASERITDVETVQNIVRSDQALTNSTNKLLQYAQRTKKILYYGGWIAVGGLSLYALLKLAQRLADESTGCMMYQADITAKGKFVKCKILGSSCDKNATQGNICSENVLPSYRKVSAGQCAQFKRTKGCVYCDPSVTAQNDPDYINYSDLPNGCALRCENPDILDALIDMIDSTLGGIAEAGKNVGKGASNSATGVFKYVQYIIIGAVALFAIIFLFRFFRKNNQTSQSSQPAPPINQQTTTEAKNETHELSNEGENEEDAEVLYAIPSISNLTQYYNRIEQQ